MKRWNIAGLFVVFACLVSAAGVAQVRGFGLSEAGEETEEKKGGDASSTWTLEGAIGAMSLRTRVSQLQMVKLEGRLGPDASERRILENYTPGAVIVSNLTRPRNAVDYIAALQQNPVRMQHGVPVLIGADLAELPVAFGMQKTDHFAPLPTMLAVAAADDPVATRQLADLYAEQLATMGFSFQAGPCLALAPDLPDAKGGLQCLGSNPGFVGETAEIFLRTFAERDLAVLFTGFPGGYWNQSGDAPPMLLTPERAMTGQDLVPYKRAIRGGARMILVGNILTPHLDKEHSTASLSPRIMKGLLRDELLYPGLVVAGPIDGLGVSAGVSQGDAAVAALKAGADMLLWERPGVHVMKAIETIVQAVEEGKISEASINVSVTRVLQLKEDLKLRTKEFAAERDVDRLEKRKTYPEAARRIERRSVTLVRNNSDVLPLTRERSTPVGITGVVGVSELFDLVKKDLKNVAQQNIVTAKHGGEIYDFEIHRLTSRAKGVRTVVIVLTNEIRAQGKVELIRKLKALGARVVVVLVGYPYTLDDLKEADAIIVMYSNPAASTAAMNAVAEALLGKGSIAVRPPEETLQVAVETPLPLNALEWSRSPAGRLPVTLESPFVSGSGYSFLTPDMIKKVRWDFGDGATSKELVVQHTYKTPGKYTIALTVKGASGESASGIAHVMVSK
ncbi:MAG: glycoside hydrolase family 3 N-terminal domain-containing protein [Candidatus Hydrogenedentota bacterium]